MAMAKGGTKYLPLLLQIMLLSHPSTLSHTSDCHPFIMITPLLDSPLQLLCELGTSPPSNTRKTLSLGMICLMYGQTSLVAPSSQICMFPSQASNRWSEQLTQSGPSGNVALLPFSYAHPSHSLSHAVVLPLPSQNLQTPWE